MRRPAGGRRGPPDPRPVPAADGQSSAGAALRDAGASLISYRGGGAGARLPRMRRRPAGALQLSRRAGAEPQQRRPRQRAALNASAALLGVPPRRRVPAALHPPARQGRLRAPPGRRMQRFTEERTARRRPMRSGFCEHPPVFTLGMNGQPRTSAGARGHPGGADRPRRPGHLSRTRAAGGLCADGSAPGGPGGARPRDRAGTGGHCTCGRLGIAAAAPRAELRACMSRARSWPASASASAAARSYHGLALNVNMDLEPFARINPCGYQGLKMTQLADTGRAALGGSGCRGP